MAIESEIVGDGEGAGDGVSGGGVLRESSPWPSGLGELDDVEDDGFVDVVGEEGLVRSMGARAVPACKLETASTLRA